MTDRELLIKSLKLYPFQIIKEKFTQKNNFTLIEPITKITDNIFLGNMNGASDINALKSNNIHYIINCTKNIPNYFEQDFKYLRIPIDDTFGQSIEKYFDVSYNFINNNNAHNIFIHCHAGISRSATILIAYLMRKNNIDCNSALNIVKNKRSIINPNTEFMKALYNYKFVMSG